MLTDEQYGAVMDLLENRDLMTRALITIEIHPSLSHRVELLRDIEELDTDNRILWEKLNA